MKVILFIGIFVAGFLGLYATNKYLGRFPILQYAFYIIIVIVFILVLLNLAGILPNDFLNRRI